MSNDETRKFLEQWFVETYDEIVGQHPDGIHIEQTRRIVSERYAQAVLHGDLPRWPQ